MSKHAPRFVAILAFDGGQALDLVGPFEVFAGARAALADAGRRDAGYDVRVVASRRRAIRHESGLRLVPDLTLDDLPARLDTLVVAGGAGARAAAADPRTVARVAEVARRARRVASVCTGAFVLAAAGLLDGRRATTHWAWCDALAAAHPAVDVLRDPIFVNDDRVWTSAGVTAGIDLALALVEDDLGRDVAMTIARWLVVFVRRAGGQSQFSAQLAAQSAEREPLRDLQSFVIEHPDAALDVPAMARRVGLSVRQFTRVFRAEIGVGPAEWVGRVRVETARRLLETTGLPVDRVAEAVGFGTPEALRRTFARVVGLAPREYRARFGGAPNPETGA
ncbi:MAG: GlxA family transcriptional regulator [Myxococcota bacterium]